jgi:exodeoxyribonuclease V alpha subunit
MTENNKNIFPNLSKNLMNDLKEYGISDESIAKKIISNILEPDKYSPISFFDLNEKTKQILKVHKDSISTHKEFFIKDSINSNFKNLAFELSEEDKNLFKEIGTNFSLTEEQIEALLLSIENRLFILTGGPGTGKTTTAAAIIFSHIINKDINPNILICAPTGRAAGRITESLQISFQSYFNKFQVENSIKEKLLNLKASTIHRLLSYSYSKNKFNKNKENPLLVDLLVIDEGSMLSPEIFYSVMEALPKSAKLVILGDSYQLPPVDSEKLFSPLLEGNLTNEKPISFEITHNFRSNESKELSSLLINIKKENPYFFEGIQWIEYNSETSSNFFKCLTRSTPTVTYLNNNFISNKIEYDKFWEEYTKNILIDTLYLKNKIDPIENLWADISKFQILTTLKRSGRESSSYINAVIESHLKKDKWIYPRIMNYNDYSLNIFNGDVGAEINGECLFLIESVNKSFPKNISGLESAFAITVHKAQGSQYENTIIVLPKEIENELNTKSMLYTAVSRAKKNVIIIGNKSILNKAIFQLNRV